MKQSKSKSIQHMLKQQNEIKQKVDSFLKQTTKAKIIYPRKLKSPQEHIQTIDQSKEKFQQQRQTPKLMNKYQQKIIPYKKSITHSNYSKQQTLSRRSKASKYQPKIIDSFAVQTTSYANPQHSQRRKLPSRSSNRSRISSQKNIFQQSNYKIQDKPSSHRSSNSSLNKQKMLTEVVNRMGIKNDQYSDNYNQYTDLKGISQYIRKKKTSGTSSSIGKAYTQPPERLQTIKQVARSSSFKINSLDRKKNNTRSQSSFKRKLDIFTPFNNGALLPQIDKNKSLNKLLNKKMKTEASSPNFMRQDFRYELKNKIDLKLKKQKFPTSKSPSDKRLLQDYKYVLENDDSQRFHKRVKPLLNEQKKKIKFLKIKEEILGKIVLDRVQKHIYQQKRQKSNYITRVKSQKSIDEALIQFLKMKVKRADKALNQ